MYLNKALIYGNITRDIELKALPSGISVASFSVATNRTWKDKNGAKQDSVDYHNVVVFGKQADNVKKYLGKGSAIFIEGRIQTRSWAGQDGVKKYRTEVVAENIQFGPKKQGATTDQESGSGYSEPEGEVEEINADEIPF